MERQLESHGPAAGTVTSSRSTVVVLLLLCVLFFVEFLVRGPFAKSPHADFAAPYVAAHRLLEKRNPYPAVLFPEDLVRAGAPAALVVDESGQRPVYPPSALPLLLPFAMLPWYLAQSLYAWASSALYLLLVYQLSRDLQPDGIARPLFVAFALGLASIHTGIRVGNLSVLAFVCAASALLAAKRNQLLVAGLLAAVTICLKPPAGIGILLAFCLTKRWKALTVGTVSSAVMAAIGFFAVFRVAPDWYKEYKANTAYLFGREGAAYFYGGNARFDLLNLQVPLYSFTHSVAVARLGAIAMFVVFMAAAVYLASSRRLPPPDYWLLAAISCLVTLLPVYQRNYNAGFILLAVLWGCRFLQQSLAKTCLLFCVPFLFPVPAIALRMFGGNDISASHPIVTGLLFSLPTWMLVATIFILLVAAANGKGRDHVERSSRHSLTATSV